MAFVPASSIAPATVTVAGTVTADVADRAGRLVGIVSGPLTDAQLAARLPLSISGPVTGPLTDAQLAARLPLGVSVGNFPADQLIHGPVTTDALTAAQLTAAEPLAVSGPLTDAQLRASRVPVDGSGVTQPVSVAALPLPSGAATEATLDRVKCAANDLVGATLDES